MKKRFIKILSLLIMLSGTAEIFAQEVLKPKIVQKLQQNVFEVVVKKIEEDPLSYEKELPLDRLPYHIRMDKYDSIGTAFLLKDGHFYTAAHVLNLQHKSQMDEFFLRSSEGKIYKIGNILKFATDRDFVIFDLIDFTDKNAKGLEFDSKAVLNSTVFAVGNAQGEGIVMRNGLLTSETPENRKGDWKWLRFSAAASPGNSGGPLVTPQGKVIGIVAMKNSSENLNYALPINEVNNVASGKGEIHSESYYNIPNILTQRFYHTFDFEMDLPASIENVRDTCQKALAEDTVKLVEKITADYKFTGKENFAQNDKGSFIFSSKFSSKFPNTLCLNDKNKWNAYSPQKTSDLKLDENGKITTGGMLGITFSYLKKEDNVSVQEYIENPKFLTDTLSKAFVMSRSVGSEKITITSYGEPQFTSRHTDNFGREWIISAFNIPFADYVFMNFSLPLPDGIFSMTAMAPTDSIWNGFIYDLKFLTDYVIAPYSGTVKEFKEYLSIPENVYPRHKLLQNASIDVKEDSCKVKVADFDISIPETVAKVSETSDISTAIGIRPDEENGIRLEIQTVYVEVEQNTNNNAMVALSRDYKPADAASKDLKDAYQKIIDGTIPYNGEPYEQDQKTAIFIPKVNEDHVFILGLVYKGSKLDIIKEKARVLQSNLSEK